MSINMILPEICLLVLTAVVLVVDLTVKNKGEKTLGWLTFVGLLLVIGVSMVFSMPGDTSEVVWGGMLQFDATGFVFRMLFLSGAALTALYAVDDKQLGGHGEFFILLLISTFGMSLMASAGDLIMLYLAIETTSIPLYVLAGFVIRDKKSVESGLKYLLYGAMTSSVMLLAFSMLYGLSGSTAIADVAAGLAKNNVPMLPILTTILLALVGFGFKISAFPFHFWAPDVYEGAPTQVTGFLSTASKAAGFVVLMRVLVGVFGAQIETWSIVIAVLATASMFIGNLLALGQKNIKRMLAYSSIAHAGTMLIGVAAGNELGTTAVVYYLMAYLVTNLAAFGIVSIVSKSVGSDEIAAYAGLSRRSPALALGMLVAILSLAGVPPFGGFFAKLLVLAAAVEANMAWLAIIGIVNAIISLYYYLTFLKVIYLYRSEDEDKPLPVSRSWAVALIVCLVGVVVIGTVLAPWFGWSGQAALAVLPH